MSAIPFRLRPCQDANEAANDALTFGSPELYENLAGLGRIEIQAETPRVRAGTIWYRIDQQYCIIEAVAIRQGMYPLVYKVLPAMVAAQLGFSYVGRYFNMTAGYANRSLIWDENNIEENGARSYAFAYPGMSPIVKLTAILQGSARTPAVVRQCVDPAAAQADAVSLNDPILNNRLSGLAVMERLEVVSGSEGTRAGTIWYFRAGNYCYVVASYLRPSAPYGLEALLPLLAAQHFGFRYVGNYSGVPADLRDYALTWDRYTGTPIPALSPIVERLPGQIDFVVTFADSPPPTTNPDPDPYPDNCESPEDHRYAEGWSYDGCHWSTVPQPDPQPYAYYTWTSTNEGLSGYWYTNSNYNPDPQYPAEGTELSREPNSPIWVNAGCGDWQVGQNYTVYYANGTGGNYSQPLSDYSGWPNGTLLGNCNEYNYYADGNGSYYQGEYTGTNGGGGNNYPPAGTVLDSGGGQNTVNVGCGDWVVSSWGFTTYADGNGGSYTNGGGYNVPYGDLLGNCGDYNYRSDGSGGYYQAEYTGM